MLIFAIAAVMIAVGLTRLGLILLLRAADHRMKPGDGRRRP
jgi:hypothetical protein